MSDPESRQGRFILLCDRDRRPRYATLLERLAQPFTLVESIADVFSNCAEEPPLAVLVDTVSAARLGAAAVNPVFEMGTSWPVLRCTLRPDDQIAVMCTAPFRQDMLADALTMIAGGHAAWLTPWSRRYMRIPVQYRARLRREGQQPWQRGNLLNICSEGAFVVTYDECRCDEWLDLEIHDICTEPVTVRTRVVWCRRWEENTAIPGAGVAFDTTTVPPELRRAIAGDLAPRVVST